jgi:hypothetical protein
LEHLRQLVAAERARLLEKEIGELEQEAATLAEELKELGEETPNRIA